MGCAVHTTLDPGAAYTTSEVQVRYIRGMTAATGRVLAEGTVVHSGGRTATAEGRLFVEADGTLIAHGSTGCVILRWVKHYTVAELEVTEPSWVRDYINDVTPMVEARGGRYLARTGQAELYEGERQLPHVMLLIEWPSREAAEEFYESEEYRPYREARRAGSRGVFMLVAGEDSTGRASASP